MGSKFTRASFVDIEAGWSYRDLVIAHEYLDAMEALQALANKPSS